MIRLYGLGAVRLRAADGELTRVLAQPKRLALLAYLALPPGGFHRRDTLVALLWPDADDARARAALRNSLYFLRRHLGDDVVVTRGDGEVGLDPARFWFDAAALEAALESGLHEQALELYGGDLLSGFFVSDAPGFEEWLEGRRAWLRRATARAAAAVADASATAGDLSMAVEGARRACVLDPFDEASVRRLIALLDARGDRAGALETYGRFRELLAREFATAPSPETDEIVSRLRRREETNPEVVASALRRPGASVAGRGAEAAPSEALPAEVAAGRAAKTWRGSGRRKLALGGLALGGLLLAAAIAAGGMLRRSSVASSETAVVLLPLANATGDGSFDYLAEGFAHSTAERLARVPGLKLLPGRSAPDSIRDDPRRVALSLGGSAALSWSLVGTDSALVVRAELVRASDGVRLWACDCPLRLPELARTEDPIVRAISERLVPVRATASAPQRARPSSTPESRLLYLKARHYWTKRTGADYWRALALLQRAIDEDPANAEAYAWLSATFGAMAVYGFLPPHETFRRAEAAALRAVELDEGLADAHSAVGAIRALYDWDWDAAERELRRALELDPGFAEARNVLAHAYRAMGRYDEALVEAHLAARLDPLEPYYEHHIGKLLFCSGRNGEAIGHLRRSMRWDAALPIARRTLIAALARQGSPDSALVAWHESSVLAGDTSEARLVAAHREEGLAATVRAAGRAELKSAEAAVLRGEYVAPMRLAGAHARAGHREAAMEALQRAVADRDPQVLFFRCDPSFDGLRDDPRFEEAARRIGLP
ncbi:MAG: BTAD domain-containing putative transcriptional regulator [Gemmatimonadota bacterium]